MKRITITACMAFLFFSCNNEPLPGDKTDAEKKDAAPADPTAFYTPGVMHKWLASFDGTWEADVISFMDPTKPDTSKAIQTSAMILNGLYQEAKLTGTMMGMPFEGRSLSGFDNAKKKFVMTWVDNVSSGTTYMTGDFDSTSKTLHLKGTQTNPSNGRNMGIREEMKIIDNNTYTLNMYGEGPDGKEIKFMEGTFRRKQ